MSYSLILFLWLWFVLCWNFCEVVICLGFFFHCNLFRFYHRYIFIINKRRDGRLTHIIWTYLFFHHTWYRVRQFCVFIWTSSQFLIIIFLTQLSLVDILPYIERNFASLLNSFLTGDYYIKFGLGHRIITIFSWNVFVFVLNFILQEIEIFLSKFTSPLISGTLSDDADFSPTLSSIIPLFHRI